MDLILRLLFSWRFLEAFNSLKAMRMLFGNEDWWTLNDLLKLEKDRAIQGTFHFHTDQRPLDSKTLDFLIPVTPFNLEESTRFISKLQEEVTKLVHNPGFDSWHDPSSMQAQKNKLEEATRIEILACSKYWLRFSWAKTWLCQGSIGLVSDTTLMFNDRPGFRNACAVGWHPGIT